MPQHLLYKLNHQNSSPHLISLFFLIFLLILYEFYITYFLPHSPTILSLNSSQIISTSLLTPNWCPPILSVFKFICLVIHWLQFVLCIQSWVWSHTLECVDLPGATPIKKTNSSSSRSYHLSKARWTSSHSAKVMISLVLCRHVQATTTTVSLFAQ